MQDTPIDPNVLTPTRTYRKMVSVTVGGLALLGLLGWAAAGGFDKPRPIPPDQAYDLLSIAEGPVRAVAVKEGQLVEKGQVLIYLDDTAEQEALTAARTEFETLAQELQASGIVVALPPNSGIGGRIVTTGRLDSPVPNVPPIQDPRAETLPPVSGTPDPLVKPAPAPGTEVLAQIGEMDKTLEATKMEIIELVAKRDEARTQGEESQRNADASKVIAEQKKQQAEKMRMLLREGVVSQVETSRAEAQFAAAQGGFEAATKQAQEFEASAEVYARQIESAEKKVKALEIERKSLERVASLASKPLTAPPMTGSVAPIVHRPGPTKPAFVRSEAAPNVPAKVDIDKDAKRAADQKLAEAKKRIDEAEKAILARSVVANRKGVIVKILVKAGDVLKPGQSVALIRFTEGP